MLNILVVALAALVLEVAFRTLHPWLITAPQRPKLMLMLVCGRHLGAGRRHRWASGSGRWRCTALGAFPTLEESVYFSLVAFSTLGLGDVVPPQEWRILAVMAAVNGFLSFGLLTALLVEALRQVRLAQLERRHDA